MCQLINTCPVKDGATEEKKINSKIQFLSWLQDAAGTLGLVCVKCNTEGRRGCQRVEGAWVKSMVGELSTECRWVGHRVVTGRGM